MRIYERGPDRRSAWLEGASVLVRRSPDAAPERSDHRSILAAKWALDQLTRAWRDEGLVRVESEANEDEPELDAAAFMAALREAPDELANFLVYSDWLSGQGDPHGQLIALHCALDQLPRFGASRQRDELARDELVLLFEHAEQLWGPLGELVIDPDTQRYAFDLVRAQWRYGFIRSARILDGEGRIELAELVAGFAGSKVATMVEALELEQTHYSAAALEALARGPWPMLHTLALERNFDPAQDYEYERELPDSLPELDAAILVAGLDEVRAPRLRNLRLDLCTASLRLGEALTRSPLTPRLRELRILAMDLDRDCVELLRRAPFAALERLVLEGPDLPDDAAKVLRELPGQVQIRPWSRLEW